MAFYYQTNMPYAEYGPMVRGTIAVIGYDEAVRQGYVRNPANPIRQKWEVPEDILQELCVMFGIEPLNHDGKRDADLLRYISAEELEGVLQEGNFSPGNKAKYRWALNMYPVNGGKFTGNLEQLRSERLARMYADAVYPLKVEIDKSTFLSSTPTTCTCPATVFDGTPLKPVDLGSYEILDPVLPSPGLDREIDATTEILDVWETLDVEECDYKLWQCGREIDSEIGQTGNPNLTNDTDAELNTVLRSENPSCENENLEKCDDEQHEHLNCDGKLEQAAAEDLSVDTKFDLNPGRCEYDATGGFEQMVDLDEKVSLLDVNVDRTNIEGWTENCVDWSMSDCEIRDMRGNSIRVYDTNCPKLSLDSFPMGNTGTPFRGDLGNSVYFDFGNSIDFGWEKFDYFGIECVTYSIWSDRDSDMDGNLVLGNSDENSWNGEIHVSWWYEK